METAEKSTLQLQDADMPRLFQLSDRLAVTAQRRYFRGVTLYIVALVGASVTQAAISLGPKLINWGCKLINRPCSVPEDSWWVTCLMILLAGFFLFTLATRSVLRKRQWERIWCISRRIAEESRRLTWLYIMGLSCNGDEQGDQTATEVCHRRFVDEIEPLLSKWGDIATGDVDLQLDVPEISAGMDRIRTASFRDQIEFYKTYRVAEQANWFHDKARFNNRQLTRCYWIMNIAEAMALLLSIVLIIQRDKNWIPSIYPFLGLAAALLAWIAHKRYGELAIVYEDTAAELMKIYDQLIEIHDETTDRERFFQLVKDCENLLAQENAFWLNRRGFA